MTENCNKLNMLLKHGIITDANKDFGKIHETIWVGGTNSLICPSIPEISGIGRYTTYDADNLLYLLLENNELTGNNFNDNQEFNKQIIDKLKNSNYNLHFYGVGYKKNYYDVKLLHRSTNIKFKGVKYTRKELADFFENDEAYILIDSGSIDFLNIFAKSSFPINRVINRETLNDPCTSSKGLSKLDNITEWIDIDKGNNSDDYHDIDYNIEQKMLMRDKFFSSKYLMLSKPKHINISNPNSKLFSRLYMNDTEDNYHTVEDYTQNNVTNCEIAFAKALKEGTQTIEWPFIYQRKRSGDWLMALSCFDTQRIYRSNNGDETNLNENIILKTIDRVLLWYCLLLGIDVLFEIDGSLLYFKAQRELTRTTIPNRGRPRENLTQSKKRPRIGGGQKSQELCQNYLKELANDLECLETDENSDYLYYEHLACIVLACIRDFYTSENPYDKIQAILFDILPSIEGYIQTKQPEIIQFFKDQNTADCVSFAARNVALHAMDLRTGSIESFGNREKYDVHIPASTVATYISIQSSLPIDFIERRTILIDRLRMHIQTPVSRLESEPLKIQSNIHRLRGSKTIMPDIESNILMAPAAGGRYKSRKLKKIRRRLSGSKYTLKRSRKS